MEGQGRQQEWYKDSHTAWADRFSGPIGVQLPLTHRPTQGQAYPTML